MKTRQELMLEFMVAMSPAVTDFFLANQKVSPQDAAQECALLASVLVNAYLENT